MIIKVLTRHNPSFTSLLSYILQKGKSSLVFTHNVRSKSQEDIVNEFIKNEALRKYPRKGNIMMYHTIVSLSSKEDKTKISDNMLIDLGKKFISLRGTNGMHIGAVHRDDTDHVHIHFMSSGTQFRTGKAARLSKRDLLDLKIKYQEYHTRKYPELTKSIVPHGQKRHYETNKEWQSMHQEERKSIKEQIRQTVTACFERSSSQKDFLESLRDNDLHFYERNGIPAGLVVDGVKIRFSRLDIPFEQLPEDKTEEDKALALIQKLRNKHTENKKELEISK